MFDLRTVPSVRAIFWLRSRILGGKTATREWSQGFVQELTGMGWGVLAQEDNRWLVAGAVCRPWQADVVFTPVPPDRFATFSDPDYVKIVWTLEAEPMGEARTRFATETRAVGTDPQAQRKLRRYWRRFGIGIVLIRWLLLAAMRREAELRWQKAAKE